MKVFLHQTHHVIADFDSIASYLENYFTKDAPDGIHLLPELFLTGYPLQDLCLQQHFISNYLAMLNRIEKWAQQLNNPNILILMGGLEYDFDENGLQSSIKNVIFSLDAQNGLTSVYVKNLLPNYDIFDERKYFTPERKPTVLTWNDLNLALLICEDMWPSNSYNHDPTHDIKELNTSIDLIVNLSASPFTIGKLNKRVSRGQEISYELEAPFAYVNRVGGEDEILFDGASFALNGDQVLCQGTLYQQDLVSFELPKSKPQNRKVMTKVTANTWESLFNPLLDQQHPPRLMPRTDKDCEIILQSLKFGVQEYAKKCGFNKFLVASSGGIDSAVVLTIMRLILDENQQLESIFMPGHFSSSISFELAFELAKKLGVKHTSIPIKFFHNAIKNSFKEHFGDDLKEIADENIQSRLRGSLLYARSNQTGAMVINTSNKSELAVGYSTLYGDSVGALSILGDLYKSEVFALANYINKKYKNIIPEQIISRPPSAELRPDQLDSHSLPPYEKLDAILEGLLSYRLSITQLIDLGFDAQEVDLVYKLYTRSEFKRFQFCPIIKMKSKSFGFGYRVPICKKV